MVIFERQHNFRILICYIICKTVVKYRRQLLTVFENRETHCNAILFFPRFWITFGVLLVASNTIVHAISEDTGIKEILHEEEKDNTPVSFRSLSNMTDHLYTPAARDAHYSGNMAQYLLDLHNAKATFNFW